ncbi:MAG: 7-carboxy-7-deazaguanine synthase QueE [Cyanobacteriota bacterium]|nr:7-carboxy-7-deazaguanine synthase QueE [Cyanobacteriota bacterium]
MALLSPQPQPIQPLKPSGNDPRLSTLPVVETFHSLQGEGLHSGRSAFFLRLAGCTVGCSWCDTKHSWPEAQHPRLAVSELARQAQQARDQGAAFVVVTGGEPLHHNLSPLCDALCGVAPLHLETSGVDPLSGHFDWITLSPKRHCPPRPELLTACQELKVVVAEEADLIFAETLAAAVSGGSIPHLLLQPAWDNPRGMALAIAHAKAHPAWRLSLQSHKWLGVR